MRLTSRADGCVELELNQTRLLLDYSARSNSSALLRYVPLHQPDVSAAAAAGDADSRAPPWSCVLRNGQWLVAGEARVELPATDSLDLSGLDAVLISSAEGMLTLSEVATLQGWSAIMTTARTARWLARKVCLNCGC